MTISAILLDTQTTKDQVEAWRTRHSNCDATDVGIYFSISKETWYRLRGKTFAWTLCGHSELGRGIIRSESEEGTCLRMQSLVQSFYSRGGWRNLNMKSRISHDQIGMLGPCARS